MNNYEQIQKANQYEKLVKLFNLSNTGLWEMYPDGRVEFFNVDFYQHFDIPLVNSTLEDWIDIVHEEDQHIFRQRLEKQENSHIESFKSEYRVYSRTGETIWIEAQGIATFDDEGNMELMVGSHTDITSTKVHNERLFEIAFFDELTGLYNRRKLEDDIANDLLAGREGTLILMDLHYLPHVISVSGQRLADKMLVIGSKALKEHCGSRFNVYRISNQKLMLLTYEDMTRGEILSFIEILKEKHGEIRSHYDLDTETRFTCAVLHYPLVSESVNVEDLINRIYLALKEAHLSKFGETVFYSDEVRNRVLKSISIETSIGTGIQENEFYVEFQPVVTLDDHRVTSFEALTRWNSPEWGQIYPDEFIPVAEKNKDIIQIGSFVLNEACRFIKEYNQTNQTDLSVAVNASVIEVMQLNYVEKVMTILGQYDLKPSSITIEITESTMLDNSQVAIEHLRQLKNYGINVAMDDFGTGYASLNSMIRMPMSVLKIDRQVTWEMMKNPLLVELMEAVIRLCGNHDIQIVIEGIENEAMIGLARDLGASRMQGYHFSKPLPRSKALLYVNK